MLVTVEWNLEAFIVTHLGIGSVFQHQVSSSSGQASYTADTRTRSGRAARALTISDHVMYNFRTSTWPIG